MLGLSLPEILFLAVLALVVVGPKQLPEVARTVARVLNDLRRTSTSLSEEFRQHVKIDPVRLEEPVYHEELPPHEANQGGDYAEEEPTQLAFEESPESPDATENTDTSVDIETAEDPETKKS